MDDRPPATAGGLPEWQPIEIRRRNRASLFAPQSLDDVKVDNEDVYYQARQHWVSVVQPIYETFIFLLFIIWIVDATTGSGFSSSIVTYILVGAALHYLVLTLTGGRPPVSRLAADPFSNTAGGKSLSRTSLLALAAIFVMILFFTNLQFTAILAIVVVIGRLTVILARWSFYEWRYITNRRLIEAGGFLGSRISSMPLSRVTDIIYTRTIPGELLGYATMRVETAGQDQALGVVRYIANPNQFYEVLVNFSAPKTSPDALGPKPLDADDTAQPGSEPPPPGNWI